jgi:hypothetical protein
LVLTLAGCVGSASTGGESDPGSNRSGIPDDVLFENAGPWERDFIEMYQWAESERGKEMLADGLITDQEFQEGLKIIDECYTRKNATVTYDRYGLAAVHSLGEGDPAEIMSECSFADDGVVVLYRKIARNPENIREEELQAQCLIRKGIVEKGFTAEDYEALVTMETGVPPPWWDDEPAVSCGFDPLGLIDGE